MGFIDSVSSCVVAILTRKGRELLAKNDGSFRISKYAFSDDEINYQLYNSTTEDDGDILNLPILEPSSNENTALRYRLVTMPKGEISVAILTVTPTSLILQNSSVPNVSFATIGVLLVKTISGSDPSGYIFTSRNPIIAYPVTRIVAGTTIGSIAAGAVDGTTFIDIIGRDSGAIASIPVTVTSTI